jgi:CheY-like chemotaxis protein
MKGDREKFLAAGMTDYLSKPIHIEGLIKAIERQRICPVPPKSPDNGTLADWMPLVA